MSSTNTFSEEGRLKQTEFAIKNVSKAGTIIGMKCKDGIVLIGINKTDLKHHKEKIYPITHNIFVAVSGLFGDSMLLKKYAQVKAQNFSELYGVDAPLLTVCKYISEKKQLFTQYNSTRPFGVSFLYAGAKNNEYMLCSTDPSGTINQWHGVAYGENEDSINNSFRNDFPREEMDLSRTTYEIIKILSKVIECGMKEIKKYEILHFSNNKGRYLSFEEIQSVFERVENENRK